MRRTHQEEANLRQARLVERVEEFVEFFDRAQTKEGDEMFTGPSLHFHLKAINLRRSLDSAGKAEHCGEFIEAIYATLASWGMHRMGKNNTKLANWDTFRSSVQSACRALHDFWMRTLWSFDDKSSVQDVANKLWGVIVESRFSVADTHLVVGTKVLHHLVPEMVPPMDREYTVRFFYGYNKLTSSNEQRLFMEMYLNYWEIAVKTWERLLPRVGSGQGMNTSLLKVIDNAIVGFGLDGRSVRPTAVETNQ